jgi:(p)ppGpp synthase/HD superfamily hydrolase
VNGARRMSLEEPIELATGAYNGLVDKAGRPYIEHPHPMMDKMATDEEKMVAILHDVLEIRTCRPTLAITRMLFGRAAPIV